MSARSRALIPLSAEQQAAMQAVAVTEQRRRQGRTLSAWPYASAFFRCLNGSRRISLTDLRFFAPALTKEEFHGNRLLWLAAVDKLIESFGEVCVLPLPSDAGHRLFPSVPFREGERRRQKTTLTEQKYSRQREREAERRELEYQTCFAQAQIDLAFHTPATVGSWLSRWSGVVEEHDLETIFWGWCGRFPSLSSFDRFFWQEEPLWRLIFEAGEAGRGAPVQIRALEQWMIPNKLENAICAKWHLNRSQFGIRIDHDLASISDHSLASQSITIWHASDH